MHQFVAQIIETGYLRITEGKRKIGQPVKLKVGFERLNHIAINFNLIILPGRESRLQSPLMYSHHCLFYP
jgi:hypothetical protein